MQKTTAIAVAFAAGALSVAAGFKLAEIIHRARLLAEDEEDYEDETYGECRDEERNIDFL